MAVKTTGPPSSPEVMSSCGGDDHVEILLLDRLGVVVGELVSKHLFANALRSESRLDDLPRHVTRTKSRQLDFSRQARERLGFRLGDIGLINLDRELDRVAFEYFGRGSHTKTEAYLAPGEPTYGPAAPRQLGAWPSKALLP